MVFACMSYFFRTMQRFPWGSTHSVLNQLHDPIWLHKNFLVAVFWLDGILFIYFVMPVTFGA